MNLPTRTHNLTVSQVGSTARSGSSAQKSGVGETKAIDEPVDTSLGQRFLDLRLFPAITNPESIRGYQRRARFFSRACGIRITCGDGKR